MTVLRHLHRRESAVLSTLTCDHKPCSCARGSPAPAAVLRHTSMSIASDMGCFAVVPQAQLTIFSRIQDNHRSYAKLISTTDIDALYLYRRAPLAHVLMSDK